MKEKLTGTKFDTPEDVVNAYPSAVSNLSDERWAKYFTVCFNRMKVCIQCDVAKLKAVEI